MKRNWKALAELGRKNWFLMLAIATTKDGTPEEAMLRWAFPGYYKPATGPVPLSVLVEESRKFWDDPDCMPEEMIYQFFNQSGEFPELQGICVRFSHEDRSDDEDLQKKPDDLAVTKETNVGTAVEWRGARFVVLENLNGDQLTIVPAGAIVADL